MATPRKIKKSANGAPVEGRYGKTMLPKQVLAVFLVATTYLILSSGYMNHLIHSSCDFYKHSTEELSHMPPPREWAGSISDSGGPAEDTTPAWWLESTKDDYLSRIYVEGRLKSKLHALRENFVPEKNFAETCGLYRFDISRMPRVTVIMTMQNEFEGMLSLSVHSILARTPPQLLDEIIIVDDNGLEDRWKDIPEKEIREVAALPKVKLIQNQRREGCARSRLIGARQAKSEVLVFVDSHIEMESGTWLQHLLVPIMENKHTLSMQLIEVLDDLGKHGYTSPGAPSYGVITEKFIFGYTQSRFQGRAIERPETRQPFETPFGPGSLFAMRRDEFWRLGGYDEGLYIWGGENTELALKTWMCGGRVMMVPCSRVGHLYRIHTKQTGHWPPHVPDNLYYGLGLNMTRPFIVHKGRADNFTKVVYRNNIRVMETWVDDHPAKAAYYKQIFGGPIERFPEWNQFRLAMRNDPAAEKQRIVRKENKCHDFEWFDKYVYMRLLGIHHPWHEEEVAKRTAKVGPPPKELARQKDSEAPHRVHCGGHTAVNCQACPQGHGMDWCNGDCEWIPERRQCLPVGTVSCGAHTAKSCHECPMGNGQAYCNGECRWNETSVDCEPKPSWAHPIYRRLIRQKPFQPVVTEKGEYVNVVMVRTPFRDNPRAWKMFQDHKKDVLFLGISSFENFPLPPINPYSRSYAADAYVGEFPGFLHNMRDPEKHFPPDVKHVLMAQSDFIDVYPERKTKKVYDFSYSGSNQEVEHNCVGWSSFNKNWTFVLEALDLMCDLNMTGVLFASVKGNNTCTIPDKCKGLIVQTPFLNQGQMHNYIRQSRFVLLPQISDASPRVSAQALSLNVPILMNKHIFGGWKYVNNKTGEFFTDMSDFQQQFTKILSNPDQYEPRKFWSENYGHDRMARKFTKYVMDNWPDLVRLPPGTEKLTPIFT